MSAQDKRIIGATDQINNLFPLKYQWAWNMVKDSFKNHWIPESIPMGGDKACFDLTLTPNEKELFLNVFSTLTTSDIVILRNIALDVMQHATAPEITAYLARQVAEEGLHSYSYQYCIEILGLDQDEVYTRYLTIPEINTKFKIAAYYADKIFRLDSIQDFVYGLIFYYCIFEGIWFYNGFSPIFALQRRNLMRGTGEQLQYIMRDEANHVAFGIKLIKEILKEEGLRLDAKSVNNIFNEGINAEFAYAWAVLPDILGYSPASHIEQAKFLANRRLRQLGLDPIFEADNVFPWLDEQIHINKEKNFFEGHVSEYQSSAALDNTWD